MSSSSSWQQILSGSPSPPGWVGEFERWVGCQNVGRVPGGVERVDGGEVTLGRQWKRGD